MRNVLSIIRQWLDFPNNTAMLSAYFVICIVGTFKNSDVLLFDGIWETYRSVSKSILGKKQRPQDARVSTLQPFANALLGLPLLQPQSTEAAIMRDYSATIEQCFPGLRAWMDSSICCIHGGASPSSPLAGDLDLPTPPPALPLSCPQAAGLDDLLAFAIHLLPIAHGCPIPSPSKLQQLVLKDVDFYLPFRELGPSRMRVTAPGGPFHQSTCRQGGAFASWVIFRALLYNSPVLHERTHCYFPNAAAWKAFLGAEHFDRTSSESLSRFFNMSCYGSPQDERKNGAEIALSYFEAEPVWKELVEKNAGRPIPFEEFFLWTQGKMERGRDAKGKHRFSKTDTKLRMVGGLTGYLLTADIVYTGMVARPTVEEMGRVIHFNGLGSLKGLARSNQIF
ncbi:hypothetical protein C8Q80DRAFT_1272878 [Daedaleopsis nitida]|nr:hypothetical protein C8Q80DRAFT_1272878 [Daedaleopsis nitida]